MVLENPLKIDSLMVRALDHHSPPHTARDLPFELAALSCAR